MDVSFNKPFNTVWRRCWAKYVASVVEGFPNANTDTNFKLLVPTSQHMIEWVKRVFEYPVQDQELVKKSFQVCGISSLDAHKWAEWCLFQTVYGKVTAQCGVQWWSSFWIVQLLYYYEICNKSLWFHIIYVVLFPTSIHFPKIFH